MPRDRDPLWTYDPPRFAGWYWWQGRAGDPPRAVKLWSAADLTPELRKGRWQGPISPDGTFDPWKGGA